MQKRMLSALLALCMTLTLLPAPVLAAALPEHQTSLVTEKADETSAPEDGEAVLLAEDGEETVDDGEEPPTADGDETVYIRNGMGDEVELSYPTEPAPGSRPSHAPALYTDIPTKYTSKAAKEIPVRDQGSYGLCWAFSAYAALETWMNRYAKNETDNNCAPNETITTTDTYDFSELHMGYATSSSGNNTEKGFSGRDKPDSAGGRNHSSAYLMRGPELNGAVDEKSDKYTSTGYNAMPERPVSETSAISPGYTVSNILFLTGSQSENKGKETIIKQYIMSQGGVGSTIWSGDMGTTSANQGTSKYFNKETSSYYFNDTSFANKTDHLVEIVGWDDDYAITNFVAGNRPKEKGAWLVKNSWGIGFGDKGYFWVSYEDINFPGYVYCFDGAVTAYNPDTRVYETDYTANGSNYGFGSATEAYFARVYETQTDKEQLTSVRFMLNGPKTVQVGTVDVDSEGNLKSTFNPLTISTTATSSDVNVNETAKTATFNYPGWYTLNITDGPTYEEANTKFAVVIKVTANGSDTNTFRFAYDSQNPPPAGTAYATTNTSNWGAADNVSYCIKAVTTAENSTDKLLSTATVTLSQTSCTYTGNACEPEVTVMYKGEPLVKDRDYTLKYKDNTDTGVASVIIKAIDGSGYAGSRTATFTIKKDPAIAFDPNPLTVPVNGATTFYVSVTDTFTNRTLTTPAVTVSADPAVTCTVGTAADGKFPVTVTGKTAGEVELTVTYRGNDHYTSVSGKVKVTVKPTLNLDDSHLDLTYGESKALKPAVTANGSSAPSDVSYTYTVNPGDDVVSVGTDGMVKTLKVGATAITVTASADGFVDGTATVTVEVSKADCTFTLPESFQTTMLYGDAYPGTSTETFTGAKDETISGTLKWYTSENYKEPASGKFTENVTLYWEFTHDDPNHVSPKRGSQAFTVSSQPVLTMSPISDISMTYGGSTAKISPTVTASGGDPTVTYDYEVTGDAVSVDENGTVTVLNAGTATITVTASADGYTDVSKDVKVTVAQKALTITAKPQTIAPSGAIAEGVEQVTADGLVGGDEVTGITLTAGETTITPSAAIIKKGETDVTANYAITYQPGTLTITAYSLTDQEAEVTVAGGPFTYDGTVQKPTVTVKYNGTELREGTGYTVTYSGDCVNARDYTVTVTGMGDYSGTVEESFTIDPKNISGETITEIAKQTYTGSAIEPKVTITGLTLGADYTVAYENNINAGTATVTVTGKGNYKGTTETTFQIEKADLPAKDASINMNAGDTKTITASMFGITEAGTLTVAEGTGYTVTTKDGNPAIELGADATGRIAITVTFTPENENYNSAEVTLAVAVADGGTTITEVDVTEFSKIYDGKAVTQRELEACLTVTTDVEGSWDTADTLPINAGVHTVAMTFTPDDTDLYTAATVNLSVTIGKRPVTVTGKTLTIKAGGSIPTLLYDVKGLVGEDDLSSDITAICEGFDPDVEGEYTITVSGPSVSSDGNYSITYVAGTLTVLADDPALEPVAKPTARPNGGTFTDSQTVTLSCATPGADIYYTTDGRTPTTSSTRYTGPITIYESTVIRAIAVKDGMEDSPVLRVTFTKEEPATETAATPTASPNGGTFTDSETVTLSCETEGAVIYYTTDGSAPTTAGARYDGPITIYESTVIRAIAVKDGMEDSAVLTVTFTKEEPAKPDEPVVPDKPIVPDNPYIPDYPVRPSTPANPGTSSEPDEPANPAEPENPGTPSTPETPDVTPNLPVPSFTDLDSGAWYQDAIEYVVRTGLMSGYGDGTFSPDSNLTRAQLAQILYNKEGNPTVAGGSIFVDVLDGQWYTPAIIWAAAVGLVGGYGDGQFGPDNNITREQLVVMLWRYAGAPIASGVSLNFRDADQASDWAVEALKWAISTGILSGKGGGILDPAGLATRAEAAQMLKNFMMIP